MNERLLAMALECNLLDSRDDLDHPAFAEIIASVEAFANLVAAAERESLVDAIETANARSKMRLPDIIVLILSRSQS